MLLTPTGERLGETADIARHIASQAPKELGLFPVEEKAAAHARLVFDLSNTRPLDLLNPLTNWFSAEDSRAKQVEMIPMCVEAFKAAAEHFPGEGPFFGGDSPHYGDFGMFHVVSLLRGLNRDAFASLGPKWTTFYDRMAALPGVKEYLAERPQAGTGTVGRPGSLSFTEPLDSA
uniref:GST C-terminal domain-containing protein n=1 Tax=Chromera velia CCMP2878 TaxID=1169474 RepID=A0A0G4EYH5_9ALVE|eukprot:Cvel_14203.t1-p1 / transcript=Cvel_14203.t1 / gene=Cvel_14203 / organism=Chromera_velia_CCMP2878 / gene_product=hypothetical protein / transcript_product=hypothetical protein / location=Cvel_scaffold1001:31551-32072(-) / protein_length=174 / sequence_SO=supercontig / SO=protein_coding / is_pseudo=false